MEEGFAHPGCLIKGRFLSEPLVVGSSSVTSARQYQGLGRSIREWDIRSFFVAPGGPVTPCRLHPNPAQFVLKELACQALDILR